MNNQTNKIGIFLDRHVSDSDWKSRPYPSTPDFDKFRIAKLMEEVGELLVAEDIESELADCFILLHAIAYSNNIDVNRSIDIKLDELDIRWQG